MISKQLGWATVRFPKKIKEDVKSGRPWFLTCEGGVLLLGPPQHSVPTLTELRALEDSLVESIRNLEPMYHAAVADEDMEKVFELLSHHYVFYFVLVLYFWEKLF